MRLSEIYASVQGEGPDVGMPTQFIRFAGCNLKCPGWPCDTEHAINPEKYRHEWETVTPWDIFSRVEQNKGPYHVSLTGGEPFLQKNDDLEALVNTYLPRYSINVFTNGTLPFHAWVQQPRVKVIMDWKLGGSGHGAHRWETRLRNLGFLSAKDSVKFVCVDKQDFNDAIRLWQEYVDVFQYIGIYVGAAWGKVTEAEVAEWLIASRLPWKLNVQVHNHIFNRDDREI